MFSFIIDTAATSTTASAMNTAMRNSVVVLACLVLSAVTLTHAIKAVATKDLDQLARKHDVVVVFLYVTHILLNIKLAPELTRN